MSAVTQVTEATFNQEVLESELPVLVDFLGTLVWPVPDGSTDSRGGRIPV